MVARRVVGLGRCVVGGGLGRCVVARCGALQSIIWIEIYIFVKDLVWRMHLMIIKG